MAAKGPSVKGERPGAPSGPSSVPTSSAGLTPGIWAFKGEATNADGLGEMSEVIIVPVMAAQAA